MQTDHRPSIRYYSDRIDYATSFFGKVEFVGYKSCGSLPFEPLFIIARPSTVQEHVFAATEGRPARNGKQGTQLLALRHAARPATSEKRQQITQRRHTKAMYLWR